ncbi:MAG: FkbM family methyltransferase [Cyclobacteriaceae bacterium]
MERILASLTRGKSTSHFFSKLIPNHYQYPLSSFRNVEVRGVKLTVDIGDYIGHCIYFGFTGTEWKSYEKLFSLCQPSFHVLDIGANIGYTSLVMSTLVGNGAVVGFEPDPFSYQQLLQNYKKNPEIKVKCLNVGLGEKSSSAFLEERLVTCRGANRIAVGDTKGIEIKLETLDTIFTELNFKTLELIKIDVEGYELKILKGGKSILSQFKPTLFIEVDESNLRDQGDSAYGLISFLSEIGYNTFVQVDTETSISLATNFEDCHFDLIAQAK